MDLETSTPLSARVARSPLTALFRDGVSPTAADSCAALNLVAAADASTFKIPRYSRWLIAPLNGSATWTTATC